jgi:hypothetical protein
LLGKRFARQAFRINVIFLAGSTPALRRTSKSFHWEKIVTVLPQDTFGISKILSDYRVETTFQKLGDSSTKVEISHYYSTTTLKAKLLNLIAKGKSPARLKQL